MLKKTGLIDIHTHGLGRHDTRQGNAPAILAMARAHGRAGVGAIVPTVYAAGIDTMRSHMAAIREAMQTTPEKGQARILGAHLEGPFLNPAKAGALDAKAFAAPSLTNLKKLLAGFGNTVKVLTIAPELRGALKAIERACAMGITISLGHSTATYRQAQRAKDAGATCVTHLFNAMAPLGHRETGLAGFALSDKDIYVEVIADGIHVSPEMLALVFRLKDPRRVIAISDSITGPMKKRGVLQGGGMPLSGSGEILKELGLSANARKLALGTNAARLLRL